MYSIFQKIHIKFKKKVKGHMPQIQADQYEF